MTYGPPMLGERDLGAFIDAHYRSAGDRLFRMERLPHYDVPSQNADREAFLRGVAPDWKRKQAWLDELAVNMQRDMVSRRVRVLSALLTDDELMSCHLGYPYTGRYEDVRVLHAGEHAVAQLLDHDYWIIEPADAGAQVVRMHYSDSGMFVGAEVVPAADHTIYLAERAAAWADAEPFDSWWSRRTELHRTVAS